MTDTFCVLPPGAFVEPTVVQITPVRDTSDGSPGIDILHYPALLNPALYERFFEFIGAARVDLEPPDRVAQINFDISVPAPDDASVDQQFMATRVVSFRNNPDGTPREELTMIDTAFYDPQEHLVITDPSIFPGLTFGGTFGLIRSRSDECIGYVMGWMATTNRGGNEEGYIEAAEMHALLPLPVTTSGMKFVIPVPCNRPVTITLNDFNDQLIDRGTNCGPGAVPTGPLPSVEQGGTCEVGRGEVAVLNWTLSGDHRAPVLTGGSVYDQERDVDPLISPTLAFDQPVHAPDGSVVLIDEGGNVVRGRVNTTGTTLSFIPEIRLRYGQKYTLRLDGVLGQGGDRLEPTTIHFETYKPVVVQHIAGIDARDVVWLDPDAWPNPAAVGLTPCSDLIAVAEGDSLQPDSAGGIRIYDVSDLSRVPKQLSVAQTAGVDRSVLFAAGPITTADGRSFAGPFLMSVDGAGDDSRFGVWRLFDLAAGLPEVLSPAVSRIVNQSRHSLDRIAGVENPLAPPNPYNHQRLVAFVPNDVGVPTDLASFGTQVSYIANLPFIGLEAIIPAQMDSRVLVDAQVQAMFRSPVDPTNPLAHINQTIPIRAVDTIAVGGGFVVAGGQRLASDVLFLTDPGLNLLDTLVLPEGGRVVAVKGLARWPTRTDPASTVTQPRDLVVAMCPNAQRGAVNLHVVAVNPAAGSSPGSPRGRFVGTGSSTT